MTRKKGPHAQIFKPPASTGRKVEIAGAYIVTKVKSNYNFWRIHHINFLNNIFEKNNLDSVRDILMVAIFPMNFISYQKLVKMVKDVFYSKGLSYELALEMGFNWHCLYMNLSYYIFMEWIEY